MNLTNTERTQLTTIWSKFKTTCTIGFFVVLIIPMFKQCQPKQTITTYTPTITGTLHDTISITKYQQIKIKGDERKIYQTVVKEVIVNKTDTAYMSIADTIRTQKFSKIMENDTIKLTLFGQVTGTIDSLNAKYTIKPIKTTVTIPKRSRFGLGLSAGYSVTGVPYLGVGVNYQLITF